MGFIPYDIEASAFIPFQIKKYTLKDFSATPTTPHFLKQYHIDKLISAIGHDEKWKISNKSTL